MRSRILVRDSALGGACSARAGPAAHRSDRPTMACVVLCIIFAPGFSSRGMRLAKIPPYERFHGPIRDCLGERLSLADDSAFLLGVTREERLARSAVGCCPMHAGLADVH